MSCKVTAVLEQLEECRLELLFGEAELADLPDLNQRQEQQFLMGLSLLETSIRAIKLSVLED